MLVFPTVYLKKKSGNAACYNDHQTALAQGGWGVQRTYGCYGYEGELQTPASGGATYSTLPNLSLKPAEHQNETLHKVVTATL